jgi:DNA-binding XRE family transcriptional regulator
LLATRTRRPELEDIRHRFNLTQVEAAQVFGVHPNTYARWERKEVAPSGNHASAIAAICSLAAIVTKIVPWEQMT